MWKKFSLLSVQLDRLAWSSQQQKKKKHFPLALTAGA